MRWRNTGSRNITSRNNRRPYNCDAGVVRPDLVLATAEDGLLVIRRVGRPLLPITDLCFMQYSGLGRR